MEVRMARRLDKIEKEMGYCEIKIEKERRLRKQIEFLKADVEALDRLIRACSSQDAAGKPPAGRGFEAEVSRRPSREEFLAAGLQEIAEEEREILGRELADLTGRLNAFVGFESKRGILEDR